MSNQNDMFNNSIQQDFESKFISQPVFSNNNQENVELNNYNSVQSYHQPIPKEKMKIVNDLFDELLVHTGRISNNEQDDQIESHQLPLPVQSEEDQIEDQIKDNFKLLDDSPEKVKYASVNNNFEQQEIIKPIINSPFKMDNINVNVRKIVDDIFRDDTESFRMSQLTLIDDKNKQNGKDNQLNSYLNTKPELNKSVNGEEEKQNQVVIGEIFIDSNRNSNELIPNNIQEKVKIYSNNAAATQERKESIINEQPIKAVITEPLKEEISNNLDFNSKCEIYGK
jgi:hypothetical protein